VLGLLVDPANITLFTPQKVKWVRYLTTTGCFKGVTDSFAYFHRQTFAVPHTLGGKTHGVIRAVEGLEGKLMGCCSLHDCAKVAHLIS
jgi:hypothetical protein